MALSGQVGRIYENGYFATVEKTPGGRARARGPRAQRGGVGPAARAGPGAAVPGHGRSHPARSGPGRQDHADQSQGLRPPRMAGARVVRARLGRDVPAGSSAGRRQQDAPQPGQRRGLHRREPRAHQVGRRTADRMAQHGPAGRQRAGHRHVQFRHRHHRAPRAGGAGSAGAEAGSHRTAGRRRGPRLQQSADGDPRERRAVAGRSRAGRSAPGRHRGDPAGGRERRGAHAAIARLQPQADHRAHGARPERGRG